MSEGTEAATTRSLEMEVTVEAPVEAVWEAISQSSGLTRWFSPEASIEPGEGGRIWLSWGQGVEGSARIEIWEPNRRLAWREGGPSADGAGEATSLLVDFQIEGKGGSTVVRLVHSGFGASTDWDEMYAAMESGWAYFLFNLAFYVVRHRGSIRRMVSERRRTARPVAEIWRRLLGREGLGVDGVAEGGTHALRLRGAEGGGRVQVVRDGRSFAGTLSSLNDGLVFVEMESGAPEWHCGVWISLYDVADERAELVQDALTTLMDEVFAG